jgi:hypothetical protein
MDLEQERSHLNWIFKKYPWMLDINNDPENDSILQEDLNRLLKNIITLSYMYENKQIHPLVMKYVVKERHFIMTHLDGIIPFYWKKLYAKELLSLPEKYLTDEDKTFIFETAIEKLTQ